MSEERKAPAGAIVRTALDTTWRTPERILDAARAYFGGAIPLDPATGPDNPTRATRFFADAGGPLEERAPGGLTASWDAPVWVNPPYGRAMREWLPKIAREATRGTEILALLPVNRTEQRYMHGLLARASAACFVRSRVAFLSSRDGMSVGGNPYASMVLGLNVDRARFEASFRRLGLCLALAPLGAPPEIAPTTKGLFS